MLLLIFFCGLHFLVGLSEQANTTLSLWEGLVHSGQKVGAPLKQEVHPSPVLGRVEIP
jgi:hypothetical protein